MAGTLALVSLRGPTTGAFGGEVRYVRTLARAAVRSGLDTHVFYVGRDAATDGPEVLGVAHPVPFPPGDRLVPRLWRDRRQMAVWRLPALVRAVTEFLRSRPGPAVIHGMAHYGWVAVRVAEALRRDGRQAAAVVTAYDTIVHEVEAMAAGVGSAHERWRPLVAALDVAWARGVLARLERRAFRGCQSLWVHYDSVSRLVREAHGPGLPIRRLPSTSESAFEDVWPPPGPGRDPRDPVRILAVGRQDPRKGFDVLIRALARLRDAGRPFRAEVLGSGDLLAGHRRLARVLGLEGLVALPGFVADVRPHLRTADVFVVPSIAEGSSSLALVEAMQAGLAPVVSGCDGLLEDVRHGENGLLVPPGSVDALAAALEGLVAEPARRAALGRAARRTFAERFAAAPFVTAVAAEYAALGLAP
jgi:glycosyltransferase involved in cell wall biosynthesis